MTKSQKLVYFSKSLLFFNYLRSKRIRLKKLSILHNLIKNHLIQKQNFQKPLLIIVFDSFLALKSLK